MRIHTALSLIVVVVFGYSAFGADADKAGDEVTFPRCKAKIDALIKEWKANGDWQLLIEGVKDHRRAISSSQKVGTWIYLEYGDASDPITVARQSQFQADIHKLSEECTDAVKTEHNEPPKNTGVATDSDLLALIAAHSEVLIYVWSPEMSYSIPSLREIKVLVAELKIPFKAFLASSAKPGVAAAQIQQVGLPEDFLVPLDSFELRMRGARRQMPILYHVKNGHFVDNGLPGYRRVSEYRQILAGRTK